MGGVKQCFLCKKYANTERHHIFGGRANRKLSTKYKLIVDLCPGCHRHKTTAVHGKNGADNMQKLHEYGQKKFMEEQGADIAGFVRIFGKNYLNKEW